MNLPAPERRLERTDKAREKVGVDQQCQREGGRELTKPERRWEWINNAREKVGEN